MERFEAWFKEGNHKWLIAGGIIAFVVLWYVLGRSGGGASSGGSDLSSLYAAQQQAAAQQDQLQGQLDSVSIQAATQQQANELGAQVQLAQIGANYYLGTDQTAAQIQESNNTLTAQTAALTDQLAGLESNNQTTEDIANISAGEQLGIANLNSQTELGISNNNAQVSIAQTNANVEIAQQQVQIAGINANAATEQQGIKTGGGIIGSLIGAFL